jgi:fructokinase
MRIGVDLGGTKIETLALDAKGMGRGGGMSKIARLYDRLPGLLAPYVFSDRVATRILAPRHGDASGVRGAAWLWRPEEAD